MMWQQDVQILLAVISAVRHIRASLNVSPAKEADLSIRGTQNTCDTLCKHENYIQRLAKLDAILYGEKTEKPVQSATAVVKGLELFVPLAGLIDI